MELERITYHGEEYRVQPINVLTGYPERYVKGKTDEENQKFFDSIETALAEFMYLHLLEAGAVERTDTVDERGGTNIECDVLVLVKCRDSEGAAPSDPKPNPPDTHDT